MTFMLWIALGLVAGWCANRFFGPEEEDGYGVIGDMVVAIPGAIIGGSLASRLLMIEGSGIDFSSVAIAAVVSVAFLVPFRLLTPALRKRNMFQI